MMSTFREDVAAAARRACVILVQVAIVGVGVVGIAWLGLIAFADVAATRQNAQRGAAAAQYLEVAIKTGLLPTAQAIAQAAAQPPPPPPAKK